jgi:hypothetical protein
VIANIGSLSGWAEVMSASPASGGNPIGNMNQGGNNLAGGSSPSTSSAPTSTEQGGASATIVVSIGPLPPAQTTSTAVALGPAPTVLQAVDNALNQLASDD